MILFAAGLLITYFNSVATEKMLTRDTGKSAELIADEFDFGVDTAGHVDSTILTVNARHALNLLHEVEFIGFYRINGTDSVLSQPEKLQLISYAGKKISASEFSSVMPPMKNVLTNQNPASSVRIYDSFYSLSVLFVGNRKIWGYALTKISLHAVEHTIRRARLTGIAITLAICVFSSILLLLAMRLTFLRPFDDLAKAMRGAAEGDMSTRLSIISGAEFKTLSSIFNEMMSELEKADEIVRSEFELQEEYNAKLQKEIVAATEALREKSTEIISLQEKLRNFESQAALGKIASKLAHEIGSPLNAIYTSVQLLLENDIQDDVRTKLQMIERQVESMITIINQLLQTRKIAVPSKKNVVLKDLVEETRLVTESRLKGMPIYLDIQLENPFAVINADPVQIQQVLINLFNNSVDAIESRNRNVSGDRNDGRGKIELKAYEDYELLVSDFGFPNMRFDVSDNGNGVPEEMINQLFIDFIESHKPNGNGLGLVICKEIVDRHDGKIFLSRNSERGSTFSIILPIGNTSSEM